MAATPIIQPDPDQMRQHLEWLFSGDLDGRHDGLIEISWTDAKTHRLTHARLFGTDEIDEAVDEAVARNSVPNQNVYIGAALRKPGTAPFARAADTDFYALPAFYVDLDDEGAADRVKDRYQHCPPQAVIVTGREPHKRAQLWWKRETPDTDPAHARQIIETLADLLEGDRSVANPSRVMRLGGTVAWPLKDGRTLERTEFHLIPGRVPAYFDGQIERAFVSQRPKEPEGKTVDTIGDLMTSGRANDEIDRLLARTREPGQWHNNMRDVIATLVGRGYSDWAVRRIVGPWCNDGAADPDLTPLLNSARVKWNVPDPGDEEFTTPIIGTDPGRFPATDFAGTAPEREWVVENWIPVNTVTALYGDGGAGKTLLAQQLAYARAIGDSWLGEETREGRTTLVLCEDDRDELHRRHEAIKAHYGYQVGNPFDKVTLWPRVGFDNMLVTFDGAGKPQMTPFFDGILRAVEEDESELLILDTVADLFGGNEVVRKEVNYFIKSVCGRFVRAMNDKGLPLSVLVLAHPSVAGQASGSGTSGSTAWSNSVRSRLYLSKPENGFDEQRQLMRMKANYASSGDETKVDLWWEDGVLKRVETSANAVDQIERQTAENRIMEMVSEAWERGEPYKAKKGTEFYLDSVVMNQLETEGLRRQTIGQALKRIKDAERILVTKSGMKRGWRLAEVGGDD